MQQSSAVWFQDSTTAEDAAKTNVARNARDCVQKSVDVSLETRPTTSKANLLHGTTRSRDTLDSPSMEEIYVDPTPAVVTKPAQNKINQRVASSAPKGSRPKPMTKPKTRHGPTEQAPMQNAASTTMEDIYENQEIYENHDVVAAAARSRAATTAQSNRAGDRDVTSRQPMQQQRGVVRSIVPRGLEQPASDVPLSDAESTSRSVMELDDEREEEIYVNNPAAFLQAQRTVGREEIYSNDDQLGDDDDIYANGNQ